MDFKDNSRHNNFEENADDEHEQEDRDYNDPITHPVPAPDPSVVARIYREFNLDGSTKQIIKARKSTFVHNLVHLNGEKFDFTGRDYLKPIYDADDKNVLLKFGRQTEKCLTLHSRISMADGTEKDAELTTPGDAIVAINGKGHQVIDKVLASSYNGEKPCLKIKTRLGSTLEVTYNHPLRKLLGWTNAENLKIGDKVASLRTQGKFGITRNSKAGLIGLMFGDGSFTSNCTRFCANNVKVQSWFKSLYGELRLVKSKNRSPQFHLSKRSSFILWTKETQCFGQASHNKSLPSVCFSYDKESTRDLIRGLWATDGHCKNVKTRVELVYCSTSKQLIRQVRTLLRKFGIVTTQREYQPKKGRKAYLIRVVTRKSIERFYKEIGPIPGKPFELPNVKSNSNLDTLPKEIHDVITAAQIKSGIYNQRNGFHSKGLTIKKQYNPTYEKVSQLQEHLQDPIIQKALDSDIIWDEVISIEDIGIQPTWAIETGTKTFISDFVVNHNTTYLGNNLTVLSIVKPWNKSLYVSPSHTQTRQFSNEKLRPAIESSPLIRKYFQDNKVSNQVFEKGFTNGSYIFLRSAFRSADRTRGISANHLFLDEIQDFIGSEIPVIMECTSHFPDANILMAGTPKSFDNPIEEYWQETSQNEWIVKCQGCGKFNFLDEKNIAPTEKYLDDTLPPGPVCKKCGNPIYPALHGKWMTFCHGKRIQGYRVPQIMVPWIITTKEQWLKLLWKRDNYPFGKFYNEVLGLSYDSASKPITRDELIECCDVGHRLWPDNPDPKLVERARRMILVGGIDWGEGNDGAETGPTGKIRPASYTVFTVGTYVNPKQFKVYFVKKYVGHETEPEYVIKDVLRLCKLFNIRVVGADWGHGWGMNNQLVRRLGINHVMQFMYLPKQKQRMKWDPLGAKFQLHRNLVISELFTYLKNKNIIFPRWADIEPYAKDILNVYVEYVEYQREMKYDHRVSDPDDFLHSLNYAVIAANIYLNKVPRH